MSVSSRAFLAGLGLISFVAAAPAALAQTPPASPAADEAEIVVTGTRVANRSRLDTVAPVDVITSTALQQSGTTELN
jgi:iron complex outermembrane receptor protein